MAPANIPRVLGQELCAQELSTCETQAGKGERGPSQQGCILQCCHASHDFPHRIIHLTGRFWIIHPPEFKYITLCLRGWLQEHFTLQSKADVPVAMLLHQPPEGGGRNSL